MTKQEFMAMSLPYSLYCSVSNGKVNYDCVRQNNVDYALEFHDKLIVSCPILYPLSGLTKEIDHNGFKIIPLSEIIKDDRFNSDVQHLTRMILNMDMKELCLNYPFWVIQKLVEWHFDIALLIEKGQAININTLSKNPYA
jgi:hypothetical protein